MDFLVNTLKPYIDLCIGPYREIDNRRCRKPRWIFPCITFSDIRIFFQSGNIQSSLRYSGNNAAQPASHPKQGAAKVFSAWQARMKTMGARPIM
ncbi:MAG: hypothetical protein R2778_06905 [Saprospiraceae bacterium]